MGALRALSDGSWATLPPTRSDRHGALRPRPPHGRGAECSLHPLRRQQPVARAASPTDVTVTNLRDGSAGQLLAPATWSFAAGQPDQPGVERRRARQSGAQVTVTQRGLQRRPIATAARRASGSTARGRTQQPGPEPAFTLNGVACTGRRHPTGRHRCRPDSASPSRAAGHVTRLRGPASPSADVDHVDLRRRPAGRPVRHLRRRRHAVRRRAQHRPGAVRRRTAATCTRSGAPRTTRPGTSAC